MLFSTNNTSILSAQATSWSQPDILAFSATLILITASVICAIVRYGHVCQACQNDVDFYFPARRLMTVYFSSILLHLVYLFFQNKDGLLYANVVWCTLIPVWFCILYEKFFFRRQFSFHMLVLYFTVPVLIAFTLFIALCMGISLQEHKAFIMGVTTLVWLIEAAIFLLIEHRVLQHIKLEYQTEYSSPSNFPTVFANKYIWLGAVVTAYFLAQLYINSQVFTAISCIAFTFLQVRLLLNILHPQRQKPQKTGKPQKSVTKSITIQHIEMLIEKKQLYTDANLSMVILAREMGTNRTTLSNIISQSEYKSFYTLVNTSRIKHAQYLLQQYPDMTQIEIAEQTGFSSRYTFLRTFKLFTNCTPTQWKENKH